MCNEEIIEIIINEDGTMSSSATGISGDVTQEELNRILGELADVSNAIRGLNFMNLPQELPPAQSKNKCKNEYG